MNSINRIILSGSKAFLFFSLFAAVLSAQALSQPLDISGTYFIDPAGGAFDPGVNDNFLSFTEAADTLASRGISGNVVINVADGTYDEAFTLFAIPGSGPSSMVTFQSASLDSSKVYLSFGGFASNSKTTCTIDGASYIKFKALGFDLTGGSTSYGQAIYLLGGSNHIYIENNRFIGKSSGTSSYDNRTIIYGWGDNIEYIEVRNNNFTYGENAIKISGTSGAAGVIVENNIFIDQLELSIYLRELDNLIIKNNSITIASYDKKSGIELELVDKGLELTGNKISLIDCYSGIKLRNCDGNPGDEGLIANNVIANSNAGGSSNYGIWIYNSTYLKIYHNSVYLRDGWVENSKCFFQESSGNNLDIQNNSFQNKSGGYAYYISTGSALSTSDNNNYYTDGNFIGRWESADLKELADLVASSGEDASSISANPWYFGDEDLHTTNYRLESKGANLTADVPFDIDGEARSTTPDIGADEFTGTGSALSGQYSIGGSGADFASLSDAAAALNEFGVSAPVIFNIKDDNSPYIEALRVEPITGSSETNTVTFRADPNNSSPVIISHDGSSGGNQTIHLVRASNVILSDFILSAENSTNSTVLRLNGYCKNITVSSCTFNSSGTSSNNASIYSKDDLIKNLTINDNIFSGGYRGIYLDGIDYKPNLNYTGISIESNSFSEHYTGGVYLRDCNAPKIKQNTFSNGNTSYNYWGIAMEYCINNYELIGNKITYSADDGGIYIANSTGTSTFVGKIINNYIDMISGTDQVNGIYTYFSTYIDIFFNTSKIHSSNSNTSSNAYYNYGGGNIKVKNNIFANFGDGRAYNIDNSTAVVESDYNDLFAAGNINSRLSNTDYSSLADFSTATGKDIHSLDINPWFLTDGEPDINSSFLDGKGVAITGITTDFYGNTRQDPPDMGAVEYTSTLQALEGGSYTIGGTDPDYATILEGLTDLQLRGIAGPVTLSIRSGEYDEHIGKIVRIPGANAADTVVLTSETGNPEDVRIYKLTDNSGGPYNVINLSGVDYFTIKGVTVSALGTSGGRPLRIGETFTNVNIINNILTSANYSQNCLYVTGIFENLLIKDNRISNGYGGIGVDGDQNNYGTGNIISGNTITGTKYFGINIEYQFSPKIMNNTITNSQYTGFEGIRCEYCYDRLVVSGNRIDNQDSDNGIILVNCDAANPFYGLVSNNMINIGGTYYARGIYIENCTRTLVYYNSIDVSSTNASYGTGIYSANYNSEIELINNIIANTGAGTALYIYDLGHIAALDYNNLYTKGTNLVTLYNTNYIDLASWQTASSMDAHSVSVDPMYYSDSDLRTMQVAFHQTATPLTQVTSDFYGHERDPSKPDIGAAEFYCETPLFNVYSSPTCFGDTSLIIDSTLNIARGSSRGWDLNGDFVADTTTTEDFDSFKWYFDKSGSNTVTYIVQQIAGCNDYVNIDVAITPQPALEIEAEGAYCNAKDGIATVSVTNISGPFEYYWSNGAKDSVATGLSIGTYSILVKDQTGCEATEEFTIGEAMQVDVTQLSPSTCGEADGSATVSVSGGVSPYTYVWSNGITEQINDTLAPGPHVVTVTDNQNCAVKGFINIESVGGPQIELTQLVNNDCYGDQNGSIDLTISGGAEPYEILWSNGAKTEDISNLHSGIYNVLVEDSDGCPGSGSFQIAQPSQISVSTVITPASCEGSDGVAVAIVSGGTKPYTFEWSTGDIYKIAEGLDAGVYKVTVSDSKGCQAVEPVIVNNVNAPEVTITEVHGVGCTVTNNGSINISVDPSNPFYSYNWSNGATTPNISGLEAGDYQITVTDDLGCQGVNQAEIKQEAPEVNPICIVTVDTLTGKNLVAWEKVITEDVSHYNVYRESNAVNDYQLVASVSVDSLSQYIDSVADPYIQSWRYKLSVVDNCGVESELSQNHKTIHLTINVGLNGDINLIWDHYEGFEVSTYKIWRYDKNSGWTKITEIASDRTSYTDVDPPKEDLTYYIEVDAPGTCAPTKKKPVSFDSSRSNRRSSKKSTPAPGDTTAIFIEQFAKNLNIYPNPANGIFNVEFEQENVDNVQVTIYDISGKMILISKFENLQGKLETQLDLSNYADGFYHLQLSAGNSIIHRMIMKE